MKNERKLNDFGSEWKDPGLGINGRSARDQIKCWDGGAESGSQNLEGGRVASVGEDGNEHDGV